MSRDEGKPKFCAQVVGPLEMEGILFQAKRLLQEHNWQRHFAERAVHKAAAEDVAPTGGPAKEPSSELDPSSVVEIDQGPGRCDDEHIGVREQVLSGNYITEEELTVERAGTIARHDFDEPKGDPPEEPIDPVRFPRLATITGFLRSLIPKGK